MHCESGTHLLASYLKYNYRPNSYESQGSRGAKPTARGQLGAKPSSHRTTPLVAAAPEPTQWLQSLEVKGPKTPWKRELGVSRRVAELTNLWKTCALALAKTITFHKLIRIHNPTLMWTGWVRG